VRWARECGSSNRPWKWIPEFRQITLTSCFRSTDRGWTTGLRSRMALVARYLRPGGSFIVSGEHPVYSCLEWNGSQYTVSDPYFTEGPRAHASWNGVPIVIQRRTLATFVGHVIQAGLQIEALEETPLDAALATEVHADPARWYSVARASVMPTTFIIKARRPIQNDGPPNTALEPAARPGVG